MRNWKTCAFLVRIVTSSGRVACVLAALLLMSLGAGHVWASSSDLLGTAGDWVVATAGSNDRLCVTSVTSPLEGLRFAYSLPTSESWVSAIRSFPKERDFSRIDGLRLRVLGDGSGAGLNIDLVEKDHADFLRWTVKVDWRGWRDLWVGQEDLRTRGVARLDDIRAIKLSLDTSGQAPVPEGGVVVSDWRTSARPKGRQRAPAIEFEVFGHDPVMWMHIYTTDRSMRPVLSRHQYVSATRLRVVPPSNEPLLLHLLWQAPGLGKVMAYADNGGQGFTPGPERHCLNLCLAESKVRRLVEKFTRWSADGAVFSEKISAQVSDIQESWNRIRSAKPEEWATVAGEADRIMGAAGCALEALELEKARADIERYGKREMEVVLQSQSGGPLDGYRIACRQVQRGFLMGAHPLGELTTAMEQSQYIRETAPATFNLGIIPLDEQFHGRSKTPADPLQLWEEKQDLLALHRRLGLVPRGSVCPWFVSGQAPWFSKLPFDAMCAELARAVAQTVAQFRDEIDLWLVINEAHDWMNSLGLTHKQLVEVTRAVVDAAREADPCCVTIVNVCLPWGEYVNWREDETQWTPYDYFEALNRAGVRYDAVGLQLYNGYAKEFPLRDLADMSALLDRYAALGKPIHITEICVPSSGSEFGSWHADTWNEQLQADYVEGLYTLVHGKPFVDSIHWFGFSDRQFKNGTGLVDRTLSRAKPAYDRVVQLAQAWTTGDQETTVTDGVVRFSGYLGVYELTVSQGERNVATQTVHLLRGSGPQRVVLSLP